MKRLFAAIPVFPDERFLSIYNDLKHQLKPEKIRWVDPENLHITLKFFGETPIEKINIINAVFQNSVSNVHPFTFQLNKTGIFGSRYKPKVIWFGIVKNKQLNLLAQEILTELDRTGFPVDRQNFVPHLTLGRMKDIRNKIAFQEALDLVHNVFVQEIRVEKITLFESKLQPTGVVYNIIENYKLKG